MIEAIRFNLSASEYDIAKIRTTFLAKWSLRAKRLHQAELDLKLAMDPVVACAVRAKRILLFEEMVIATGFPDPGVVDELRKGGELVGEIPATGMLPGKLTPALSTLDELHNNATRIHGKVERDVQSSGDAEVDNQVWQKTLSEVAEGWLVGPLENDDVPSWQSISKLFGLIQKKGKLRLIDDYTESGVNSCVTSVEAPVLHTVDIACAVLVLWFDACVDAGISLELLVRTFDLKSAYRQVGLSSSGRDHACIRVFDPVSGKVRFFRSNVLPFGSIRSVHSFLRLSRAIWWIGVVGCRLVWTSFYDDFIAYSRPNLASNTEATISNLFKLLGWAFAESGDKCVPFSSRCEALGVSFDLGASFEGRASICNTAGRVEELCADLESVLQEGTLNCKQAQRLRGRMQFADAQLFGRTGKRCLKTLGDFSEGRRVKLQHKDRLFLRLFSSLLKQNGSPPSEVRGKDCPFIPNKVSCLWPFVRPKALG